MRVHRKEVFRNIIIAFIISITIIVMFTPMNALAVGDPTYYVHYNGNGNTGGSAPTTQSFTSGGVTISDEGSLVRTGYSFAGWNTAAGGTGTSYSAGDAYSTSSDVTLYAQWTLTAIMVGPEYGNKTITAALANATDGDTIIVTDGTYTENVVVSKEVTILSLNGSASTTVQASSLNNNVFYLTANNVTISGFNITGSTNAGIYSQQTSGHTISNNIVTGNWRGIYFFKVSDNTLSNNIVNNCYIGIWLYSICDHTTLVSNTVSGNDYSGIQIEYSDSNTLTNNNLSGSEYGLYIYSSTNNSMTGNTMSQNMYNFRLDSGSLTDYQHDIDTSNLVDGKPVYYLVSQSDEIIPSTAGFVYAITCDNISVSDATFTNVSRGVMFYDTDNSLLENVTISDCYYGIYMDHSNSNTLSNSSVSDVSNAGIYMYYSDSNTLSNNSVSDASSQGIYMSYSDTNTLTNNTVHDTYSGIEVRSSVVNTLTNNNVSENDNYGIYLYSSSSNTLENNTAITNDYGISIGNSQNVVLTDNIMSNNTYNFMISGSLLSYYQHNIDITNLVNGSPIYYLVSQSDQIVPSTAGTVYAISCDNITVRDITVSNIYEGIRFYDTDNSIIENVTISDCNDGIYLKESSGNTLTNNTLNLNNNCGFYLYASESNALTNNNASINDDGIYLQNSGSNILTNNTANENEYHGIYQSYSGSSILANNTASGNDNSGIYISNSDNSILSNNTISQSYCGIEIYSSSNLTLTGSIISQNIFNFYLTSSSLEDYQHNIDTSNLLDGKPVYYLVNHTDEIIPSTAAMAYAINCTNISVSDASITNVSRGVLLYETDDSTVENTTTSECNIGIYLEESLNNTLNNNDVSGNENYGIYVEYSANSTVSNNTANNDHAGIYLSESANSTVSNNTVNDGNTGISVSDSSNSIVSNNTVNENTYEGICVDTSANITLSDNTVSVSTNYGIRLFSVSYSTIADNTVSQSGDRGIYLYYSTNNNLTGNTANNNENGFYIYNSGSCTLRNNSADNNTLDIDLRSSNNVLVDPFILGDDLAELTFTSDSTTTQIVRTETNSNAFTGKTNVNGYITISSALSSMNMSLFYSDSGMTASKEATLALYKLNGTEWDEMNATVNTSSNTVIANLTEFGTFALFKDSEPVATTTTTSSSSGTRASVSQGQSPEIVSQSASSVKRIIGGSEVNYDFSDSGTPVLGVSFDAKTDEGLVVAKVQVLSSNPEGVPSPSGKSYQMMSIDVGSEGTISSSSGSADNIQIRFKVSKQWIEENNIDVSTIRMTRYNNGQWGDLPTYQEREEDGYIYFYAETPGFSVFNVVGDEMAETTSVETVESTAPITEEVEEPVEEDETSSTPGFTAIAGVVFVSLAVLLRRK
nr:NosD domain-containing protein [uncultured Methanolobus sp.]